MVHHDKRYDTLQRAAQEKNGVAVIGVLYHVTTLPNPFIEKVLENSKTVFDASGRNATFKDKLMLSELLPRNKQRFFRYEGSLTTPSCGEAVLWTVFEDSIGISADQVSFL
jgi:carbonic anhydrase